MSRRIAGLVASLAIAVLSGILIPLGAAPAARAVEGGTDPLRIDIETITPGAVPRTGPIRLSGTVTNLDQETWTDIRLYSFISLSPMRTAGELEAAVDLPADTYLGDRIVDPDATGTIDEIAPGDSVAFSFQVPRDLIPVTDAGVYWFGVQALGQGPDGRDLIADGRARTFLPLVRRRTAPLDLAVVVPLRKRIQYAADGRLDELDDWITTLSTGGRLRSLVDLGLSGSSRQLTYLVDPALVSAVTQLAAGNPVRSLQPTLLAGAGQGADEPSPSPGTEPSDSDQTGDTDSESAAPETDPSQDPAPADGDAAAPDSLTVEAQDAATDWLARLQRALPGHEVLAVPYGDLDVPAAAASSPDTYAVARSRATEVMAALDIPAVPTAASPGGFLDPAGLALTDPTDTVLISDDMFDSAGSPVEAAAPTVATEAGRRIVVTSRASTSGPGPGDPRSVLSMRQSTLAQAAVRAISADPQPVVLLLPNDWNPVRSSGFFSGFDLVWLDLQSVSEVADRPAAPISLADLAYPRLQARTQLPADNFAVAQDLIGAGEQLQLVLTRNDQVGTVVRDQALTTLGYTSRGQPAASRAVAAVSQRWIVDRLGRVTVDAPKAFTMTGTTADFSTTIVNGLPQPVTVGLRAQVTEDLEISRPVSVEVPASSRTRVLLTATAPSGGIHSVTVRLTDSDGVTIGGSDRLTIRSLEVSNVIWVFIGAAGALLFGAIALRLLRRIRAARRPSSAAGRHAASESGASTPSDGKAKEGVGA